MTAAEVAVTVTREEHHQDVLSRWAHLAGSPEVVAAELGWCTIAAGKYRGEKGVEVLVDGRRVGELTYLMSRRYAPLVSKVLVAGARPGCEAFVHHGSRGLEITLRLPKDPDTVAALPMLPAPSPTPRRAAIPPQPTSRPTPQRVAAVDATPRPVAPAANSTRKPLLVGGGIFAGLALLITMVSCGSTPDTPVGASSASATSTAITTTAPTTSTTTEPPAGTTTTEAPVVAAPPATPTTTTTKKVTRTTEALPPKLTRTTADKPAAAGCNANYSPCVPTASDVDCEGGSGNGPAYVKGPVTVTGKDVYGLDHDKDGVGCE
ncbi:hypothetical protein [Actinokineospora pegani]|uniref:hypothetical protein n=1 Tax=Actinokineospora pegani TaxID=2654637 RepID=UPI0018D49C31|nr:hypothetical protein [Actinokineospora pegani]